MKQILSFLFIMMCPFMLGAFFPVILMKYGVPGELALLNYMGYSVFWVWIWAVPFDEGRRLSL